LEKLIRLKKEEQDMMNRKYCDVLNWFSAANSTIQDHHLFQSIRSQHAGSGDWILKDERVQNWMKFDIAVSSVLWLNGIPGAGMPKFLLPFLKSIDC
jgi:hypothetical protein